LALLRIVEPSAGRILIDNINIAHINLDTIRSRLTVVPQDPFLFSGSIRLNLDPCNAFNDFDLWNALELAHMKAFVESLPKQLEHEVSEGGSHLVS
jgi:ATP-binding cassette subfamily C (CFTR/MRP) protein 1